MGDSPQRVGTGPVRGDAVGDWRSRDWEAADLSTQGKTDPQRKADPLSSGPRHQPHGRSYPAFRKVSTLCLSAPRLSVPLLRPTARLRDWISVMWAPRPTGVSMPARSPSGGGSCFRLFRPKGWKGRLLGDHHHCLALRWCRRLRSRLCAPGVPGFCRIPAGHGADHGWHAEVYLRPGSGRCGGGHEPLPHARGKTSHPMGSSVADL